MGRPADWWVLDLDGDPTPGDPTRVQELAGRMHGFAGDVATALRDVKGLEHDSAVQTWAGQSGDAYREQFGDVPGELTKLERSYRMAGDALTTYWPKLQEAQRQADRALEQGRTARHSLTQANGSVSGAEDWVKRANQQAQQYEQAPPGAPPPDPEAVRAATRNARQAQTQLTQARNAANAAQSQLDAAKRLAEQAAQLRDTAANHCVRAINEASDAGIQNKRWWEKAVDWVADHWDEIVTVCKWIVAIAGIIVLIVGGPLAWLVLAAALVVLADTIMKYAQGKASAWMLLFAALDCIPGGKGITSMARLGMLWKAGGLRSLGRAGLTAARGRLGGMANALRGSGSALRAGLTGLRQRAVDFGKRIVCGDPVDVATGEVVMRHTDVELAGLLPLVLTRTHVSSYRSGRWYGRSWASTLDQRLEVDEAGVCFAADDGMVLVYPTPEPGGSVLPLEGPRWPLTHTGDGGYTVTYPQRGRVLRFAAADAGRPEVLPLAAITDRNGHAIEFDYAADGTLTGLRHSGGYRVGVETADGRVTGLTLLGGGADLEDGADGGHVLLVRYGYDKRGQLTEVINSSGLPMRFEYDPDGRIAGWQDRNGVWFAYRYDEDGRCVRSRGSGGALDTSFAYDRQNRVTVATNSLGHATTYHLNDAGQVVREIDPLGHATVSEWDRYDRLLARTDPVGRTVRYEYDQAGNVAALTRPDGSRSTVEYNDLGQPVRIVDATGAVWRRAYDDRGNLTAVIDPLGTETTYTYDERGHLNGITDALGHGRRIETDPAGLPLAVTDTLGATTRYTRDAFGRAVTVTDPVGGTTHLSWTVEGKLAARTLPDGATERWSYDGEGNLVEHVDALGQVTRIEVTHFDLPSASTGPDGARLEFSYDTELRLVAVTNPQGLVWRYDYDPAGNLVRETDFNGRVLRYAHDAARQLVQRTNGAGEVTRYSRDPLGNVVEQRSGDAVTTFEYDPAGRLVRAVNADAELTFELDALGRVLAETCNGRIVASAYDALGRRRSRRTPSGAESSWEYDANGRPVALHRAGHTMRFNYDAAGREIERWLGTDTVLAQTWSPTHRLLSQTVTTGAAVPEPARDARLVQSRSYRYRSDGYVAEIGDLIGGVRRFDLDPVGRVTAVQGEAWSERYAYDTAGNITHATWPSPPDTGTGDTDVQGEREYGGSLIRRAGNVRYEHDAQGRVILRQQKRLSAKPRSWHYTWDADDRLVAVTTPDGRRWRYRYDPLGRRIAKQRLADDGVTVDEQVDFSWDGTVLAEQVHSGTSADGRAAESGTTSWDWAPGSVRPLTQTERPLRAAPQAEIDERFYAIVTDLVGTPTELVTSDGEVAWQLRATVWGAFAGSDAGEAGCPLRFPGQYADPESGFNYNCQRHYDAAAARYSSGDPLGLIGGDDPHAYGLNPSRWIDPLGLMSCAEFALDAGAGRAFTSWDQSVAGRLLAQIGNARLVMPQTAADEFLDAVNRLAGPNERALAADLMSRVNVVADNPSARVAGLTLSRRVGANDVQIFGTADNLGIPIITADFNFLRGAFAQGVELDAIVIPSITFLGR